MSAKPAVLDVGRLFVLGQAEGYRNAAIRARRMKTTWIETGGRFSVQHSVAMEELARELDELAAKAEGKAAQG